MVHCDLFYILFGEGCGARGGAVLGRTSFPAKTKKTLGLLGFSDVDFALRADPIRLSGAEHHGDSDLRRPGVGRSCETGRGWVVSLAEGVLDLGRCGGWDMSDVVSGSESWAQQ